MNEEIPTKETTKKKGRPKALIGRYVVVRVRLTPIERNILDTYCETMSVSMSSVIRESIFNYIFPE